MSSDPIFSRREFVAAAGGLILSSRLRADQPPPEKKAQIAITFDLEMARNFPRWEDTHWDYEKGNLTDEVKHYSVEAARRVTTP